jgi:hypothetical protein
MPGEDTILGEYTAAEVAAMSMEEFLEAKQRGFTRPALVASPGAETRPAAAGVDLGSSVKTLGQQPAKPTNVWGRNKGKDFTCPSGQTCKLRPLALESLMMEGILDKVTRLEGLAQELINVSSGVPPEKAKLPSREDFAALLKVVNIIVPLAVAEPRVYPDDYADPVPEGAIMVSDIDLEDRLAILNEAMIGLKNLDKFRPAG